MPMSEAVLLTETTAPATPREPATRELQLVEPMLPTCELAECTCPDFCERDHANE
jgi:hypothetical protein